MLNDIDDVIYLGRKPTTTIKQVKVNKEEYKDMTVYETQLDEMEIEEQQDDTVEDESGGSLTWGFIGIGQCGGRLVEAFYNLGYKKCFIINTASQDLNKNTVPEKMLIQAEGHKGGAGKDMALAERTIEAEKDSIYNKMRDMFGNVDHIFVTAGLGGGTGGGAITTVLETAKRYMEYLDVPNAEKRVGAIVTLPTMGEASSPLVAGNAYEKGNQLSDLADMENITPLVIVDNDKVKRLYKKLTVANFFPTINNSVAQLLHVFNTIIEEDSDYITFDSMDFRSIIEVGGHMIMGVSTVRDFKSKTSISEALKKNLSKTLLAGGFNLERAKAVGCVVVGGEAEFETVEGLMENIEYGFSTMAAFTGNAKVHRGIYSDPSRNGRVNVYTVISGLEKPVSRYEKLRPANYGKAKKGGKKK